jgi:hypothetical protein
MVANISLEHVTKFGYLGTAITNQNCIYKEIKGILNLGNACYLEIQTLLSCLLM